MNKTISFIVLALVVTAVWFIPDLAFADPSPSSGASGGFVTCNGSDCSFCHIIDLGSNILNWLFGLVFVLFGVIAFVAGFGLATSGGNQAKLDDAKKKLSNAFVGLIIVFSAWLIVDTLMKALVPGGETSIGPWNAIDCGEAGQAGPVAGSGLSSEALIEDDESEWSVDVDPDSVVRRVRWRNIVTGEEGDWMWSGSTGTHMECQTDWGEYLSAYLADNPTEPLQVLVNCALVE